MEIKFFLLFPYHMDSVKPIMHSHPVHIPPKLVWRDIIISFLVLHSQPSQEARFRYCAFLCAFKINTHWQPLRLSATTKKTLQHFEDPGCTYTKSILPLEQSCPTDSTGIVVAEGKLCWESWSLYKHRSTVHFSAHPRPLLQRTSQASRGEPSLLLSHLCDHQKRPLSMPKLTEQWL